MSAWDADTAFRDLKDALGRRPQRPLEAPLDTLRESAVVVPVVVLAGVPHLLFTRRPDRLRHHGGQISFPGGARDASDGTALFTALRELEEELGVRAAEVDILGPLDEIPTPSGFRIAPFVGRVAAGAELTPHPDEVEELLRLPVARFFAPGLPRVEERHVFGRGRAVYFYEVGPHVIWGATAHILRELLAELAALPTWKGWTMA